MRVVDVGDRGSFAHMAAGYKGRRVSPPFGPTHRIGCTFAIRRPTTSPRVKKERINRLQPSWKTWINHAAPHPVNSIPSFACAPANHTTAGNLPRPAGNKFRHRRHHTLHCLHLTTQLNKRAIRDTSRNYECISLLTNCLRADGCWSAIKRSIKLLLTSASRNHRPSKTTVQWSRPTAHKLGIKPFW
jgi:hypothetical protein